MALSFTLGIVHDNVYIIGTIIGISLMFLTLSLVLHFRQHFKCQSCCPSTSATVVSSSSLRPRSSSLAQIATNVKESRLRCLCGTHDGDDFDFFPMAFFIYLILIILLCLLLIARFVIMNINGSWHESHIQFTYPSIKDLVTFSFRFHDGSHLMMTVIDYTAVYCIMIMSLMENCFNFYRYYTTLMTTKKLLLITTGDVIKQYALYSILFILLYTAAIHFYFWIFPLIILLHCVFGVYCTWGFASALITSYTNFVGLGLSVTEANQRVLRSVYFMRKTSLICTVLQSLYLFLFMLIYSVNVNLVIIYLPLLWSITSFIFALNFVRNRESVQRQFPSLKCAKKKKETETPLSPLEGVKTFSADRDGETDNKTSLNENAGAIETDATIKHVSFNAAPLSKHVSFDTKLSSKDTDSNTMPQVMDVSEPNSLKEKKPRAASDGVMAVRITEHLAPLPIDVCVMPKPQRSHSPKSGHARDSPHSGQDSPYTPSSASIKHHNTGRQVKHHLTFKEMANDTMRSYNSHLAGQSMELTRQISAFEMSVFTETDVGGGKLEEYNRHLAASAAAAPSNGIMPTPKMRPHSLSNGLEPAHLNIASGSLNSLATEEDGKRKSLHHQHKLDPVQLALQLSLLKKFGFNVNRIEKSLI